MGAVHGFWAPPGQDTSRHAGRGEYRQPRLATRRGTVRVERGRLRCSRTARRTRSASSLSLSLLASRKGAQARPGRHAAQLTVPVVHLSLAVTKSSLPRCAMVSRLRPRAPSPTNSFPEPPKRRTPAVSWSQVVAWLGAVRSVWVLAQ